MSFTTVHSKASDGSTSLTLPRYHDNMAGEIKAGLAKLYSNDKADEADVSFDVYETADKKELVVKVRCPDLMWPVIVSGAAEVCNSAASRYSSPFKRVLTSIGSASDIVMELVKDVGEIVGTIQESRKKGIEKK